MYYLLKVAITSLVVVGISGLARRFSWWAAILASLPLTSILALIWLYQDTKDMQKISQLSTDIFWMVLPSLLFFLILPLLIKLGMRFYPALLISCALMSLCYLGYALVLRRFGIMI